MRKAETVIVDVTVPGDFWVKDKENEKILKCNDLAIEISSMWNMGTKSHSYSDWSKSSIEGKACNA